MINRVRLVGAVPRLAPLRVVDGWWRLDTDALRAAVTDRTRAIFVNNASFPSGWVASREEWEAIAELVTSRDLRLVYWASYEGVLFDGREVIHPAALPGMRDRTVTVGDVLAEQRMIGWRIGWVVAPGDLADDVARVHIYSGLLASGFAQIGARVALQQPPDGLAARERRVAAPPRRDASAARRPSGRTRGRRLVASPRRRRARPRLRRGVGSPARAEGRGDTDARLGRRDRRPSRPLRVQQRAGRTAGPARRPRPPGPRRRGLAPSSRPDRRPRPRCGRLSVGRTRCCRRGRRRRRSRPDPRGVSCTIRADPTAVSWSSANPIVSA